ncbi:MAG: prepilin-type N-terminal cleavage/methylation domain-containing protein [Clostridiales bacterium]|nr:prepilin-type N-terminal cleavage/methylation domain-containing protein [Clostridiales bacterium]
MKNHFKKSKKNQKGFTLVELMVVVVIIGILVAIAVPVYRNVQTTAKIKANDANIKIIESAIQVYLAEGGTLDDLDINLLVTKGYLKEVPKYPDSDERYSIEVNSDGTYKIIGPVYEETESNLPG